MGLFEDDNSDAEATIMRQANAFTILACDLMRFLTGAQTKVLCCLINAMLSDDYSLSSAVELAEATGLSDRTIRRTLDRLEDLHLIAVDMPCDYNDFKCWVTIDSDSASKM